MLKKIPKTIYSKKPRFLFLSVLIFIALGLTNSSLRSAWNMEISGVPTNVEVVLRADGFYPANLKVSPGSIVTFRSETGQLFWPASSFHPTHGILPEFDPRKPIEASGSWEFIFNETGTWRYHDHLDPAVTGTITVEASLVGNLLGFNDPCRMGGKSIGKDQKIRCWQKEIDSTLQKKGIDAAFVVFSNLYNKESGFSSACHDMTHLLGEAAYHEFTKTYKVQHSEQTVSCSYGFYHGFIEAMLHSGQGYERVLSYCKRVQEELELTISSPSAYTRCFHGIGHGVFDTLTQDVWGDEDEMVRRSLAVCRELDSGDPSLLFSCAKGVFNALTNAYAYGNYGLKLNLTSPFDVCRMQSEESYRRACHVEIGLIYIRTKGFDFSSSVGFIEKNVPEESSRAELILAQISQQIQDNSQLEIDLPGYVTACQKFSSLVREKCLQGILEGIFISGQPGGEYEDGLTLCRSQSLTASDRDNCYVKLRDMIYLTYPKDKALEICRKFEPAYQTSCN